MAEVDPYAFSRGYYNHQNYLQGQRQERNQLAQQGVENERNRLRDMYLGEDRQRQQVLQGREDSQYADEQKIQQLRMMNAAAAEVSQNPQAITRWGPQLEQAGMLSNAWQQMSPEELQSGAKQLYDSTTAALQAFSGGSGGSRVQSAQILANGNIGYLTTDGRVVDTGQQAKEPLQLSTIGGAPAVVNLRTATPTALSTPEQERAAAAAQAGAVRGAQVSVETAADQQKQSATNSRSYSSYQAAMQNLSQSLGQTATGPVYGLLPALTANQQVSDAALAAMAPILKQLFRSSGEGVFTDRDQQLLLDMIPDRKVLPEARGKIIEAIDAIVKSKLGVSDSPQAQAPPVNAQGWKLMIDASGNRAYVGPNGEIEEL